MSVTRGLIKQKSYGFGLKKREHKGAATVMSIPDAVQAIKEKIIYDSRSAWANAEILYHINILKRVNNVTANTSDGANDTSTSKKIVQKMRFLIVLKKKETIGAFNANNIGSYYLLQVGVKDNGLFNRIVEVKNSWDMKKIRGVDIGGIDNDFVLSVDKGDMIYTFTNILERDETIWVIIQLCKLIASSNTDIIDSFSVGYSVDLEAISYTIITNGTLNRFPTLFKLFTQHGLLHADTFGEEEVEAESLLEDMKWTTGQGTPQELQQTLTEQSNALNTQIIDYLLQWEELDDTSRITPSSSLSSSLSSSSSSSAGMRNTVEILDALNHVDDELEEASLWLSIQIDRLSEIKSHLIFIEDESGGLESSWQNLQSIRDVINAVIKHLTIDKAHENILRNPEPIISSTTKSSSLSSTDHLLSPVIEASSLLADAISYKGDDQHVPPQIWKQIRTIKALSDQKNRLYKIAEEYASISTEAICNIIPSIIRHKSLNDDSNYHHNIDIKTFKTSAVILHRKRERRKMLDGSSSIRSSGHDFNLSSSDPSSSSSSSLYYIPSELNVLLHAQRIYHETLSDYIPLTEKLFIINPESRSSICKSYIDNTHEMLYSSLFKTMMREYRTLMPSSRYPVTLSSINRYSYKGMKEVMIRFSTRESLLNETQQQLLPPWELFAIFLLIITPVVLREEAYFQIFFNIDGNIMNNHDHDHPHHHIDPQAHDWLMMFTDGNISSMPMLSETNAYMASLFTSLIHLVHKLSAYSSSDIITKASTVNIGATIQASTPVDADVDIVETVGLLAVLYQFVYHYLDKEPPSSSSSSSTKPSSSTDFEVTSSLVMMMYEMRGIFLTRLHAFETQQIKWIQSYKHDIKRPGVSAPCSKLTSLAHQVLEMVCGQMIDHVDHMIASLLKEIIIWISSTSQMNVKHADVFKLQNLMFLEETLYDISSYYPSLKIIIDDTIIIQRQDAESRYIMWMLSYEFGGIGMFANKMERLGAIIRDDEMILYISSKDVSTILKEYDIKKCEAVILSMRKRLKKHCDSTEDQELQVVSKLWAKLKTKASDIISKFITAASIYKMSTDNITVKSINAIFDKYATK